MSAQLPEDLYETKPASHKQPTAYNTKSVLPQYPQAALIRRVSDPPARGRILQHRRTIPNTSLLLA
jgi:hypothetical protein